MKKIMAVIAFAVAALFMVGCAGTQTPQEKSVSALLKIQNIKKNYWNNSVAAGMGIGESVDEQTALEKADQNARVDLAKSMDSYIKAIVKNFKEEVGGEFAEHFESVSKNKVKVHLNGATMTDMEVETTEAGKYKIYGVVSTNIDVVNSYLKELTDAGKITAEAAEKIRAKAAKAYDEMEKDPDMQ
ncbi:MAG: LPP20 family lipoprotein [Fibrobacter sp.]|nr:LPP20 family lipoprotein [Fibrobacter sp.]